MSPAALMRIRIDYVRNNIDATAQEYRSVILDLIMEIERLNAANVVHISKFKGYPNGH
jgi:hypothetical protein